mmetsp:Transcript_11370/g.19294  ORF Transcript_11370/g.19294 Transcript_11370/m.19294 type:complete len:92 (+) Transcript_11370:2-277(+)
MGLVDESYRPKMTEDEAVEFVAQMIQRAMNRDGSSGGVVRIYVLNKEGSRSSIIYPQNSIGVTEEKDGISESTWNSRDGAVLKGFAPPSRV